METRSRKRAEATPSEPSSSPGPVGPTTRAAKRARLSTNSATPAVTPSSISTRSGVAATRTMDNNLQESSSRGRNPNRGVNKGNSDKGKAIAKEPEIRRDRIRETVVKLESRSGGGGDDTDDEDSEEDGGMLNQNLTNANTSLHGLFNKLGAGLDDRHPSSSSSQQNGRFKKILSGLRGDPGEEGKQVESLRQLCEILSLSTEDTLSTFSVESFVPVLVRLLNHENNPETMLLAARAISHLVFVLPSSCASVVHYGAVSCFVSRLLTIEYMDLAEQSLSALKFISQENPTACLRAGALMAVLQYIDFFSTGDQRVALCTAENMCKKLPSDASDFVMDAVPLLTKLLQYQDAKVLEHTSICLTRITESFASSSEKLDELCNHGLVAQAASLISTSNSGGGQAILSTSTCTGLFRLLSTCVRGSHLGAKTLLLLGVSGMLKDILIGSGLVSSTSVSPALTRPPDQILEIVSLANELLPIPPEGTISLPAINNQSVISFSKNCKIKQEDVQELSPREILFIDQPQLLQQFGVDLLPVLIQIYGSTVNTHVRHRCLSVIGKLMYFSTAEMIQSLITVTNISSFLAGVLAWKDPQMKVPALQIAEILMEKLPHIFSKMFVREGVVHYLDTLIIPGPTTTQPLDNLSITGSSRSRRNKRRGVTLNEDTRNSVSTIPNPTDNTETSIKSAVSACAEAFKEKYFPSDPEGIDGDLKRLKDLCAKVNFGVNEQRIKAKGRAKANTSRNASKEENLVEIIAKILQELSKGDGVSTFEFIGSGVINSLLNYFTCGYFSEKISSANLLKLRNQALQRYTSFISLALPSSVDETSNGSIGYMSVLIQKLQKALSSIELFPVIISHSSNSSSTNISSHLTALSRNLKLRLCKAEGEKSLRDYSSNIATIDPFTTLIAVEDFLWPKIQLGETTSQKGLASSSRPRYVNISDTRKNKLPQGKNVGLAKGKGKGVVLKPVQDKGNIPLTRNAARRRAALDKDESSSSEDDDDDVSSSDDDESEDEYPNVPRARVFNGYVPDVFDVKLSDTPGCSTSKGPATASSSRVGPTNRLDAPSKLIFTVNGNQLNRNLTIYQAVQRQNVLNENDEEKERYHGDQVYSLTYQRADTKLAGPTSSRTPRKNAKASSSSNNTQVSLLDSILQGDLACDLEKTNPTYHILALLRVLEALNQLAPCLRVHALTESFAQGKLTSLDELNYSNGVKVTSDEFINSKLTPKLARQIQDTHVLCSGTLPSWCHQLTRACPFLFPFETRRQYFYSTAFGLTRALYRLHQQQVVDGVGPTSERVQRLRRQKVRVSRNQILESAIKVMELYSSDENVLEVEYFGEVGTGLGPTLEFYTLLSNELQRIGLGIWRSDVETKNSEFIQASHGLFPRPWDLTADTYEGSKFSKTIEYFKLMGSVMAKALQDGRILDLPLSTGFYKLILGQELNLHDILSFDPELGKTLQEFQAIYLRKLYMEDQNGDKTVDLQFRGASIEDLCLDFTLPGYPEYVLKAGKENVDIDNLGEYISLVVDATVKSGITRQMDAFRSGFNQVFDISSLQIFSPNELDYLICGHREPWKAENLIDLLKFDHGYTANSPPIINLLEIMREFTPKEQCWFCRFVTGAPRLPPGGLAVLNPKLTIVRKHPSTNRNGAVSVDDDLPSVMTCANYLKLPPYSTKEIMYKKVLYAISEGQGSFDLS